MSGQEWAILLIGLVGGFVAGATFVISMHNAPFDPMYDGREDDE